ncbi:MAG: biopolymer transporter ExbD [Planctomycetota bacterium]
MATPRSRLVEMTADMDMTPMIDVVFNLIIFFMLVSHFTSQLTAADVVLPDASCASADVDNPQRLVVNVSRDGTYRVMGVAYPAAILTRKVAAYGFLHGIDRPASSAAGGLHVRADRRTPYKFVQQIYNMAQAGGIAQIGLAAQRPPTAQGR